MRSRKTSPEGAPRSQRETQIADNQRYRILFHSFLLRLLQSRMASDSDPLFEADTPLGFRVRVDKTRWELIVNEKHPVMKGREQDVRATLTNPDEVRQSKTASSVLLFYRMENSRRWVCAVAKRSDREGFLITAYPTDAIKEGARIWPK